MVPLAPRAPVPQAAVAAPVQGLRLTETTPLVTRQALLPQVVLLVAMVGHPARVTESARLRPVLAAAVLCPHLRRGVWAARAARAKCA